MKYILIILCLVLLPSAWAQAVGKRSVEITASSFEMDLDSYISHFRNNVNIQFENYHVTCQRATVYMDPKTRKVTQVIMSGNVQLKRGASIFKGKKVTLDVAHNRLKIEGGIYTRLETDEFKANLK